MGDLMIGQGKGLGTSAINRIEPELLLYGQPSLVAEYSVRVDGAVYLGDAVFG